jgi:CheY-like chemotaxis protein
VQSSKKASGLHFGLVNQTLFAIMATEHINALNALKHSMSAKRILVADDDQFVRDLMRALLAPSGYAIEEAADGEEAVRKCLHDSFDLLLIDHNMPEMSGPEACAEIRRQKPHMKVLMLSGRVGESEPEEVSFLLKPFENHELLTLVRQMLAG